MSKIMISNISRGFSSWIFFLIALISFVQGCASDDDHNRKVLEQIAKYMEESGKQPSGQGISIPAEAIVRRFYNVKEGAPEHPDNYWLFQAGKFSPMTTDAKKSYENSHKRFDGKTGEYYLFQYFLFNNLKSGANPAAGVLILPNEKQVQIDL